MVVRVSSTGGECMNPVGETIWEREGTLVGRVLQYERTGQVVGEGHTARSEILREAPARRVLGGRVASE